MADNGDKNRCFNVGGASIKGIGSFHKTLNHDPNGEVNQSDFQTFLNQTVTGAPDFEVVPAAPGATKFINPLSGMALDRLVDDPSNN